MAILTGENGASGRKGDRRLFQRGGRGIGGERYSVGPRSDAMRSGGAELGGVEAEDGAGGAAQDRLLEGSEVRVRVADALGVHAFAAKECGVEAPVGEGANGLGAEKDGLTVEKHS